MSNEKKNYLKDTGKYGAIPMLKALVIFKDAIVQESEEAGLSPRKKEENPLLAFCYAKQGGLSMAKKGRTGNRKPREQKKQFKVPEAVRNKLEQCEREGKKKPSEMGPYDRLRLRYTNI